ncbi:MAG: DUF1257 domain-containing protein [Candidatus Scalindua sp.]|jgi:hypothetical protein|nr:DUF1257 domain-containing protein [Candidatus Scalindua sp.]
MSENITVKINLKDEECLVESLKELGFVVEQNEVAQTVKSYYNRTNKKAHVILRKVSNRGLSADIGFELSGDEYLIHHDSMDKRKLKLKALKQLYSKHRVRQTIRKKNTKYSLKSEKVDKDGRIRIKVALR